ncbi:vWA domain-containing protein [Streptomyces sp. Ac-502]|uniref:vWA domain-containing protein n=1 Tax=Streptomyces sp. Ac-502 TaxID=3342801 RepID=UPI0038626712
MNVPHRTVPAAARTRRGARRAIVAALTALCATVPLGPPPAWAAPTAPSVGPMPVDFSVVVDASASIGEEALAREAEAAALIGQGEISDRSRASVIGFGSAEKEGQQPVREVCPPTVVDAAGRQRISDCARRLTDREGAGLGPGTDFPAALTQALTRLKETSQEGTPKVVFLLTDGRLNVEDSPAYGADPAARKQEGEKRLREVLDRARREQVQIWPLGFGKGIDEKALQQMADGGYRNGCADVPGSRPRPEVVDGAADVDKALQGAFAAARCARVEEGTSSKPPGELAVDIPPIATDGSITVTKRDPRVTATYYDPKGRKVPLQGSPTVPASKSAARTGRSRRCGSRTRCRAPGASGCQRRRATGTSPPPYGPSGRACCARRSPWSRRRRDPARTSSYGCACRPGAAW